MLTINWKYEIGTRVVIKDEYQTIEEHNQVFIVRGYKTKIDNDVKPAYELVSQTSPFLYIGLISEEALLENRSIRFTEKEHIEILSQALQDNTGIAPIFSIQLAEMLLSYYGPPQCQND